jgi:hypothetical protein
MLKPDPMGLYNVNIHDVEDPYGMNMKITKKGGGFIGAGPSRRDDEDYDTSKKFMSIDQTA